MNDLTSVSVRSPAFPSKPPTLRGATALLLIAAFLVGVSPLVMNWEKTFPDFICYWAAGKLLAEGQSPYDAALETEVQRVNGWDRERDGFGIYDFLPFYYPPWFGLLFVPLLPLGFTAAKVAWYYFNLSGAFLTGYFLTGVVPNGPRRLPVLMTPLFLFTVASVLLGQTAIFIFFLLVLAWLLLDRGRDWAAGACLAWLSVKPQLAAVLLLGVLVWLARRRRWQALGAFFITGAVLVLGSALVLPDWPLRMLNAIRQVPSPTEYYPWIGNAWLLVLRALGLTGPLLWMGYLALALPFLAVTLGIAWNRDGRLEDVLSAGALAAFFVAPYARHYDFPVLLVPLVVVLTRLRNRTGILLAILFIVLPYVQMVLLNRYRQQHDPSGKFLIEATFFWVPLLLAAVWAGTVARRQAVLTASAPPR
jgi:hypothetical protein